MSTWVLAKAGTPVRGDAAIHLRPAPVRATAAPAAAAAAAPSVGGAPCHAWAADLDGQWVVYVQSTGVKDEVTVYGEERPRYE